MVFKQKKTTKLVIVKNRTILELYSNFRVANKLISLSWHQDVIENRDKVYRVAQASSPHVNGPKCLIKLVQNACTHV